jgi:hypothetical protein
VGGGQRYWLEYHGSARWTACLVDFGKRRYRCSGLVGLFIFDRKEDEILYAEIKPHLKKFHYADIHGESDFLKIFLREIIDGDSIEVSPPVDFRELYEYAEFIQSAYALPELENHLNWIINECLLGMEKYNEYIDKTKPTRIDVYSQDSNLRLNIQQHINIPAEPIDILLTFGERRKSSVLNENIGVCENILYQVFNDYLGDHISWFDLFKQHGGYNPIYDYFLLQHLRVVSLPRLPFKISYFSNAQSLKDDIKQLVNDMEILTKTKLGIPLTNDKWVFESLLYHKIKLLFTDVLIIRQGMPVWLKPQRFDVWVPNLKFAVEYNGIQHYEPVDFFGGVDAFKRQVRRDRRKEKLCLKNGVRLFIVRYDEDMDAAVLRIRSAV